MYNNACNSAQSLAREVGVHRTTVVEWIKRGKVKAMNHRKGRRWYIGESQFTPSNIERLKKPYPKYSKPYSESELHVLRTSKADVNTIARILKRTPNAIRIKMYMMRKNGMM